MSYCTVNDVKRVCGYPATGAPISDADILLNILDSQEFIEEYTGTVYWSIEANGTATGGDAITITDSGQAWTVDEYVGYTVWVYEGTNAGEYREITSNDATSLTVSPAFSAVIDATSKYRVVPPSKKEQTLDGNDKDTMFLDYYPIRNIYSLTVDSTSVTISTLHIYENTGQIALDSSSEVSYFSGNERQLIDLVYFYGVYPIPRIVQRLCAIDAGIRTYASQIGATYDDFTTIALPELSGSLGEPYMNIKAGVDRLIKERDTILGKLVRKKVFMVCG